MSSSIVCALIPQPAPHALRVAQVTKVIEGRTTHFIIHALLLLSVTLAPLLQLVPKAVLYGVFLFMGVGSMAGNQLFDRVYLLFIWREKALPRYQ